MAHYVLDLVEVYFVVAGMDGDGYGDLGMERARVLIEIVCFLGGLGVVYWKKGGMG